MRWFSAILVVVAVFFITVLTEQQCEIHEVDRRPSVLLQSMANGFKHMFWTLGQWMALFGDQVRLWLLTLWPSIVAVVVPCVDMCTAAREFGMGLWAQTVASVQHSMNRSLCDRIPVALRRYVGVARLCEMDVMVIIVTACGTLVLLLLALTFRWWKPVLNEMVETHLQTADPARVKQKLRGVGKGHLYH